MKLFSAFIGTSILSVLSPSQAKPLFDVIAFSVLVIAYLIHPNLSRSGVAVRCSKAFFLLFGAIIASYLLQYMSETVGGTIEIASSFLGLKMMILGVSSIVLLGGTFIFVVSMEVSEQQKTAFLIAMVYAGGGSALLTNIYWIVHTGATFDRYNFVPPITGSQGLHLYYMAVTILFAIALFVNKMLLSKTTRLLVLISSTLAFFSIATVMVREGWAILSASLILSWLIISSGSRWGKSLKLMFIAGGVLLILYTAFEATGSIEDLFISGDEGPGESVLIRIEMIEKGLRLILENVVFGVGYGNFTLFVSHTVDLVGGNQVYVASPHNAIILLTSEVGVIGLLSIAFLCSSMLVSVKACLKSGNVPVTRAMAASFFPFLLLLSMDQFISNSLFIPQPAERHIVQFSYLLWMTVAVLLAKSHDGMRMSLYDHKQ